MKKLVVFSGAGVSAESGISTFRDQGGLWDQYDINEVATPEAFERNPALVLDFYHMRRQQIARVKPNNAHLFIAQLDKHFHTTVITQNIDDLHERGGSKNVLHLHGEITWAYGKGNPNDRVYIGYKDIQLGDVSLQNRQLRPDIVWFGEAVPKYEEAMDIIKNCDILVVVGTSLNVYPAAGLIYYAPNYAQKYIVDPNINPSLVHNDFTIIQQAATQGIPHLVQHLLNAT